MPAMRLFGRRCALATDDFFFIGAIGSITFLPWLPWIPVIYASYLQLRNNCEPLPSLTLIDVCLPCLCVLFLANWLVSCLFLIFSTKGTISEPEPRRHVITLVYVKLFISVLDLACAILGTVILVNNVYCDVIGVPLVIKVATSFQWAASVFRIGMIILFYDWSASKNTKVRIHKEYFTTSVRRGTMRRWNLRLQAVFLWCTTPTEARKEAFRTASELMALLSCDLDLVASDVIAGLLLYRQKCLQRYKRERIVLNASPSISHSNGSAIEQFPPDDIPEWMNLQVAKRYFNIGLGVFGWPWYLYTHFNCGCCHLIRRLICCFPCRHFSQKVLGDNCCGCNLAGLQATTSLPYEDLVHVSFVDRVYEVPFFVTYDHETKVILIIARGTMSIDDVLTDVSAGFSSMDDPGCPPGALAHHGILSAAREIKRKLEDKEVISKALEEMPDYKLVVTGHSLGAAVASVLSILLKHSYPNIRCYAFAPPPTINKSSLSSTFDYIFTVNYGNDSVPFLNYENVKIMVKEMVKCLNSCKMPKYQVFLSKKKQEEVSNGESNRSSDSSVTNEGVKLNGNGLTVGKQNMLSVEDSDVEGRPSTPCVTESMCVAGTILHIRQTDDGYRLKISTADEYKPLAFRPNMIFHHFPQNIQKSLEDLGKTQVVDSKTLFYPLE